MSIDIYISDNNKMFAYFQGRILRNEEIVVLTIISCTVNQKANTNYYIFFKLGS